MQWRPVLFWGCIESRRVSWAKQILWPFPQIFPATGRGNGGIVRSTDGGDSWEKANTGLARYQDVGQCCGYYGVTGLLFSPTFASDSTVYLATWSGFLAGIECDGAMYHSAKSAKDRDALRQAVLEDMGWTIYRVWSTDWYNDPRSETQKLVSFLEQQIDQKIRPEEIVDEMPWGAEIGQSLDPTVCLPRPPF